ncbi:ATP-binding protein [Bradyrhizobium septentrionale]|uniref:ATP-binding protein n=1 Tax=Bradyrhizobium septentrionale TaxID=1404411 RepID=UPI003B8A617C
MAIAKLRQQAAVEDIDYRTPRGLDRSLLAMLVEGGWIAHHANLPICGPPPPGVESLRRTRKPGRKA